MKRSRTQTLIVPDGHRPPTSRRDFLRYGLIPFAGQLLMPAFSRSLLAAPRCEGPVSPDYIPFLVFDMAGGAAMPGNFLVGKQGGPEDLAADYSRLGWNPRKAGALDTRFGAPMAKNESKMLAGILASASPAALARLRLGTLCHFSQDDTTSNTTSALHLVARAGLRGRHIRVGVGNGQGTSGGNSAAAQVSSEFVPVRVTSPRSIQEAIGNGPVFASANETENSELRRAILGLSLGKLVGASETLECAYRESARYGRPIDELDPVKNPAVGEVYPLNQSDKDQIAAAIVYNVVQGNTGPGAITLGGYDYHDQGQQAADDKDQEMGVEIGRAVELAHRLGKPLFFQVITDGGVASEIGGRAWVADSNVRGLTVVGYYHPRGAPSQRRLQIGDYTAGGIVNQEHPLLGGGADSAPAKAADIVLANYLAVCGKLGQYESLGGKLRTGDVESALIFG